MMTAVASVIDSNDPIEVDQILDQIVDPAGSFYRFNLAHSLLRTGNATWKEN
jgi:F420-non-reducing hydrogenase small subunit